MKYSLRCITLILPHVHELRLPVEEEAFMI